MKFRIFFSSLCQCLINDLVWNVLFYRVVKLSSPKLNYLIIIGAVLMYCSIYFYLLPIVHMDVVLASCIVSIVCQNHNLVSELTEFSVIEQLQHWLFTIGYSLAFGMVLAKMWRIYQIFHNPTPNKKVYSTEMTFD